MSRGEFSDANNFIVTSGSFPNNEEIALGAWVYLNSSGSSVFQVVNVGNSSGAGQGYRLSIVTSTGGKYARSAKAIAAGVSTADSSTSVSVSTWAYVFAHAINDSSRKSWMNNTGEVENTDTRADPSPSCDRIHIGWRDHTSKQPFLGYLAEVSIWTPTSGIPDATDRANLASGQAAWTIATPPARHYRLLGSASPEPDEMGGASLTMNGTVPAQVGTHPTINIPATVIRGNSPLAGAFANFGAL